MFRIDHIFPKVKQPQSHKTENNANSILESSSEHATATNYQTTSKRVDDRSQYTNPKSQEKKARYILARDRVHTALGIRNITSAKNLKGIDTSPSHIETHFHFRSQEHNLSELTLRLSATGTAGSRPREVSNGDDEEAVASIGDTGQGVVPGSKGCQETEETTCLLDRDVDTSGGIGLQVGDTEEEEGQVQEEEEQEEGDGRFEGAEEHDGGEDEPALIGASVLLSGDGNCIGKESGTYHQEQTH
jgi:hypothetical protein